MACVTFWRREMVSLIASSELQGCRKSPGGSRRAEERRDGGAAGSSGEQRTQSRSRGASRGASSKGRSEGERRKRGVEVKSQSRASLALAGPSGGR